MRRSAGAYRRNAAADGGFLSIFNKRSRRDGTPAVPVDGRADFAMPAPFTLCLSRSP